jgi:hypothetical protein
MPVERSSAMKKAYMTLKRFDNDVFKSYITLLLKEPMYCLALLIILGPICYHGDPLSFCHTTGWCTSWQSHMMCACRSIITPSMSKKVLQYDWRIGRVYY